jgi:hypothetical protein
MNQLIFKEPHQEICGQLHCQQHRMTNSLNTQWLLTKPWRPIDILLFGATHETWLHSFKIGITEQIVKPFPFLHVMHSPNYTLEDLLLHLEPSTADSVRQDNFSHARLAKPVFRTNNRALHFQTAKVGTYMQMRISGAVEHVVVLGIAVD